jgi:hypothetical protein
VSGSEKSGFKGLNYELSGGYFASNKLSLGMLLSGGVNENRSENTGAESYFIYHRNFTSIGFVTRYYVPVGQKFNFYLEGNVGRGWGNLHHH